MAEPKQAFVEKLRTKPDAADLAQEVYLRMLLVSDMTTVRNPEAYLYAVASNLAKEHAHRVPRDSRVLDIDDPLVQEQLAELPPFGGQLDTRQRVARLGVVLQQLRPKCRLGNRRPQSGRNFSLASGGSWPRPCKKRCFGGFCGYREPVRGCRPPERISRDDSLFEAVVGRGSARYRESIIARDKKGLKPAARAASPRSPGSASRALGCTRAREDSSRY